MSGRIERRTEGLPIISSNEFTDKIFGLGYSMRYENPSNPSQCIQATIAPERGGNLVQFQVNGHEIIFMDPQKMIEGLWTGCFNLWPFPNRMVTPDGKKAYTFRGETVSLEEFPDRIPNDRLLIHGLVDEQIWDIEDDSYALGGTYARVKTGISITKDSPQYKFFPWESRLTMEYIVSEDGLKIRYEAQNKDPERDMPSVFAIHPYFLATGALVRIPADSVMEADERLIPNGRLLPVEGTNYDLRKYTPVEGLKFDDVWTDLHPGKFPSILYPDLGFELVLETSEDMTHTVCYTGEVQDGHFCLENQSGATNAINMDNAARDEDGRVVDEKLAKAAHLVVVPPEESHKGWIKFRIRPLLQAA